MEKNKEEGFRKAKKSKQTGVSCIREAKLRFRLLRLCG
jgi:hypothetical protein